MPNGDFVVTEHCPLGVCLGIGAWNYPIQIASWKAAPALAAGNAMIFKPSETTPLSALKLAEIFIDAGAPAGLFNVVQGRGAVGAKLIDHPNIAKRSQSRARCRPAKGLSTCGSLFKARHAGAGWKVADHHF